MKETGVSPTLLYLGWKTIVALHMLVMDLRNLEEETLPYPDSYNVTQGLEMVMMVPLRVVNCAWHIEAGMLDIEKAVIVSASRVASK